MPGLKGEPLDKRLVLAVLFYLVDAVENMLKAYRVADDATDNERASQQAALRASGKARVMLERLMTTAHYEPKDFLYK